MCGCCLVPATLAWSPGTASGSLPRPCCCEQCQNRPSCNDSCDTQDRTLSLVVMPSWSPPACDILVFPRHSWTSALLKSTAQVWQNVPKCGFVLFLMTVWRWCLWRRDCRRGDTLAGCSDVTVSYCRRCPPGRCGQGDLCQGSHCHITNEHLGGSTLRLCKYPVCP